MKFSDSKIIKAHGLKCDVVGCGYEDETIEADDYVNLIGTKCPKCGASLLTQEDYNILVSMLEIEANLLGLNLLDNYIDESVSIELKLNGTGNVELGEITTND